MEYYTTDQAAQKLGLSRRRVLQYCLKEKVRKVGWMYLVTDEHIEDMRRRRHVNPGERHENRA